MASHSVLNSLFYENIRLLLIKYVKMKEEVEEKKNRRIENAYIDDLPGK